MQKRDLLERLQALHPQLAAEGVEHLYLYGSRARQDNSADSDIDLLVEFAPTLQPSILNLIGVEHIVGDDTGLVAHARPRDGLRDEFYSRIVADIIEVF
ncbi:MAG: nucleotidyltransferase domain-containing protein [Brucellaceae bacterium]|nr:nucleotidyltransferase domain-containing protein [Brucellaceae bacterium]